MTHAYKSAVLAAMHSVLKPAGFRKRGATFRRPAGDVVHVVQMQSSRQSSETCPVVTVNLGIFSLPLERALNGTTTEPGEIDCHFRERIGFLDVVPRDIWWTLLTELETAAAAQTISSLLRDKALALFGQLESTSALQLLWMAGQSPGLTAYQRDNYLRALASVQTRASVT